MTGRGIFKILKPILNAISKIMQILPLFIFFLLWDSISNFGGKLFVALRYILLKSKAEMVGDNVYVGKYVVIKNIHKLSIGSNVSIHDYSYVDGAGGIEIGDNVSIAHNSSIITANHTWTDINIPIKYNKEIFSKVIIKNDVWIGCGVRILSGVTLESRTAVAAGAVVNKSFKGNSLIGGVPAKLIKDIN